MRERLLDILRCAECKSRLELSEFESNGVEIIGGLLTCSNKHIYPVVQGIPRMLPNSLAEYRDYINERDIRAVSTKGGTQSKHEVDKKTKLNFSNEWNN